MRCSRTDTLVMRNDKGGSMLGNDALEFLKRMYKLDEIWKDDGEAEYSERQLVQFAERYHESKSRRRLK